MPIFGVLSSKSHVDNRGRMNVRAIRTKGRDSSLLAGMKTGKAWSDSIHCCCMQQMVPPGMSDIVRVHSPAVKEAKVGQQPFSKDGVDEPVGKQQPKHLSLRSEETGHLGPGKHAMMRQISKPPTYLSQHRRFLLRGRGDQRPRGCWRRPGRYFRHKSLRASPSHRLSRVWFLARSGNSRTPKTTSKIRLILCQKYIWIICIYKFMIYL
jgi:hypothetical protein